MLPASVAGEYPPALIRVHLVFPAFGNSSFNTFIFKSRGPICAGRGIIALTLISLNADYCSEM
jgi:hypothetical protein